MKKLKKLFGNLENVFAAAAFAEAGEFETARQIASEDDGGKTGRKELKEEKHEEHKGTGTPYPSKV